MQGTADILDRVFGFSGFRPGQQEIVDAVSRGDDVLAILPTGAGKSLCFQLPALMRNGVTVVISPLIALMRDQVASLQQAGVAAGALTSLNTEEETEEVFQQIDAGTLKLLYMAPERLASIGSQSLLQRINVQLLAVDEAHCVSQWGHDFRPDYLKIGDLRRQLGGVQTIALTATADADTRDEIIAKLFDTPPTVFIGGFDRPNLSLAFEPKNKPRQQVLGFVAARKGQPGIIYCASRNKTEQLASALIAEGHQAQAYHAGMEPNARRAAESRFKTADGLVMCATVAFGMGVDKPDIRFVVHADLPKSVESYYQEVGRAGRDGAPADTLTFYGADDIRLRRAQIDEGMAPVERKEADHARLNALLGLAEALKCRRQVLLGYFGEEMAAPCGNCDLCETPPELFDGTTAVRKALSAMLRSEERYGSGHLIDILLGNKTTKITQRGHHNLQTFGAGREYSKAAWQAIFRQMMGRDLVRPDMERFGALRMMEDARAILRGEESIELRRDTISKATAAGPVHRPAALVEEENEAIFSALRALRTKISTEAKVPPYVVFADKALAEMARNQPRNLDEFARISGVGRMKLERYGALFLEVINQAPTPEVHPARRKLAGRDAGPLFDQLQKTQIELMRGTGGTGTYLVCANTTLAKIAAQKPKNLAALAQISGVGEQKAERFGEAFLEIILAD
ncbi:MAG: DNA helicase RecQ [Rhodobacteraceae bacterium]|nr:DNA helicase RecQ [Paracoccaceae bacterium]